MALYYLLGILILILFGICLYLMDKELAKAKDRIKELEAKLSVYNRVKDARAYVDSLGGEENE